jgi:predicted dehydrogenase
VRVGVVGLGFGARVHVPGFRLLESLGARVDAVCARGRPAEPTPRGVRVHRDWRELVTDPELDLVSIATPPREHAAISLAALEAGSAVLCEKPLGLDAAEALEVAEASADGPPALVNFSYRGLPAFRRARELLHDAALGEVEGFRVDWHMRARDESDWAWTWKDSCAEGGGALASYGVHALDYVEWLLGPASSIAATVRSPDASRTDRHGTLRPVTADPGFTASLELASGAAGEIEVALDSHTTVHRVEIAGARGRLVLENVDPSDPVRPFTLLLDGRHVELERPEWRAPSALDARVQPFATLAAELLLALRDDRPATPSPLDGARALALVEAVLRASGTGRRERPQEVSPTRPGPRDKG